MHFRYFNLLLPSHSVDDHLPMGMIPKIYELLINKPIQKQYLLRK